MKPGKKSLGLRLVNALEDANEWHKGNKELRTTVKETKPTDLEIRKVFLRIWTKHTHQPGYDKQEWQHLRRMLLERGIVI